MAGFRMPPPLSLVAIAAVCVALVMQIVGVATAAWLKSDNDILNAGSGLWESCSDLGCVSFGSDVPDWLDACRAFGILGSLFLLCCAGVAALTCFSDNDKLPLMAVFLSFAAGVCVLIEFAVYADKVQIGAGFKYGYSFALTVVACILAVLAGIFFLISRRRGYQALG